MMRFDGHSGVDGNQTVARNVQAVMPFGPFAFCPAGVVAIAEWTEIYRIAYERTAEALRPTRYDWALRSMAN